MRYLYTLIIAAMLAACGSSSTDTPTTTAPTCEGTYTAEIIAPDHETRIAARNQALAIAGYTVTGDDSIDNHVLGGGDPDGGIYLSGNIQWTTGPLVGTSCPITGGTANIFGYEFSVSGGMNDQNVNTVFSFGYEGGPVTGEVHGTTITGKLMEGGGREFVHGVFVNGVFTPKTK